MKNDRLNDIVIATLILVFGVILAIACGRFAGNGNNFMLAVVAFIAASGFTCFILRGYIWVLIPMFWSCTGQLNSVPGHLPLRDLIVIVVSVYFFTLKAFKQVRVKPVYSWLDALVGLNILCIVLLYIRFPTGLLAFGADLVGGRPYFEVLFAVAAYWVLNQVAISHRLAKFFPLLLCAVPAFFTIIKIITHYIPATAPILGKFYGGVDAESYQREMSGADDEDVGASRVQFLSDVGMTIFSVLCSYFQPLTLINPLYVWRFLLTGIAVFFCLKSGHRITIPSIAFTMLLATYFRKGFASVIILVLLCLPPMVLLVAGQGTLYKLPAPAQRTLCFLPGKWDPDVVAQAEDSKEWRFQMWDIMMHDNKYIHDKMFGDGFGYTKEVEQSMAANGSQEDFMYTNNEHSGPISAIRVSGYVGLGLFLLLLLGSAIRSWQVIRATKDSPFYPLALFIGIGTIYTSFGFVFIFGAYGSNLPDSLLTVALLNIISNGFAAYRKTIEAPVPVPPSGKSVQPLAPFPLPAPVMH